MRNRGLVNTYIWPVVCGLLVALLLLQWFPQQLGPDRNPPAGNDNRSTAAGEVRATATPVISYAAAVRRAAPSVVNIYTRVPRQSNNPLLNDPNFRRFLELNNLRPPTEDQTSLGSGVIISSQGYVLTSKHVIDGAAQILALLHDGREAEAMVIGVDDETDLAVLRIQLDQLVPAPIGNPAQAEIGDVVLAIGNPFGIGQTVTQGIISATGRNGLGLSALENFIQTDAAINPGNSGGALVDAAGNLLGINAAILNESGSVGVGFATPIDMATRVVSDIVEKGYVSRGWMGIEARELTAAAASNLGISPPRAMLITGLYPGGPGDAAGLQIGDVLTGIDNQHIADGRQVVNRIADADPGDRITLSLIREGTPEQVTVTLSERPPN